MAFSLNLATNPDLKRTSKIEHGFKVTSDGRLIIKDDDEEDDESKGKRCSCIYAALGLCLNQDSSQFVVLVWMEQICELSWEERLPLKPVPVANKTCLMLISSLQP